jgi:hypothetical protein
MDIADIKGYHDFVRQKGHRHDIDQTRTVIAA